VPSYSRTDISNAFNSIRAHFSPPSFSIRAALWNVGHGVWKPFLDITPEELQESLDTNVTAAFAFSREVILTFKDNEIDVDGKLGGRGKRGTLLFTGATASLRGNTTTAAFAIGKHGLRALSQSLAKEFGKQNIHVGLLHSVRCLCKVLTTGLSLARSPM
jgi:NAD(P)-dependent dehydrogenase (short-subunit alcohol dehydrogenase family)